MKRLMGLALVLAVLGAGCAPPGYYQKPEEYYPYISDAPPSFYDYDPAMRHWYTMPYWNPNRSEP